MRKIDGRELVKDLRSGVPHAELMEKYGLTPRKLERALEKIAEERLARAQRIAQDIKAGVPDWELMRKYQLSTDGLNIAFQRLVREGLLTETDLESRGAGSWDAVILDLRTATRHKPAVSTAVIDLTNPAGPGSLLDISEGGVQVSGLKCRDGEIKKIAVIGDEFGEVSPFEFEAECRWHTEPGPEEETTSGFKITNISDDDMKALREFIDRFTAGEEDI